MTKTVAFHTLGCKVNQYEEQALKEIFLKEGYKNVAFQEKADVYVIITCTVTHLGDKKSRQIIRRAIKTNPDGIVVATGCYAQTSPEEVLNIPGINLVVGTQERGRIVSLIEETKRLKEPLNLVGNIMEANHFEELPVNMAEGRTRAFVKVQEGCDNFCSYCIIPYARGPLRSRQPENVISEIQNLVNQGFQEIVLTGIHTGAYGRDLAEDMDLASLLIKIETEVKGLNRIRLGSIEPMDISLNLIQVIAESEHICPHLHIPMQSGNDEILTKMNRNYSSYEFYKLISVTRSYIKDLAVTTDIIVGFPGETDNHFDQMYHFIELMNFSNMHIFKFSPRKGTPAADFSDQVDSKVKEERSSRMLELAEMKANEFAERFIGKEVEVLVEHEPEGEWSQGLIPQYLRVYFKSEGYLSGELVRIIIDDVKDGNLYGHLAGKL